MMEPTRKEIQWLLKQCGFKYGKYDYVSSLSSELNDVVTGWLSPEATSVPHKSEHFSKEPPPIDLNFLFRYALPQLGWYLVLFDHIEVSCDYYVTLTDFYLAQPSKVYKVTDKDPALALFWAIYKAFGGE